MSKPKKKTETPVTPITREPAAKMDPHEPLTVDISGKQDHALLHAAALLYCKHLEDLRKKADTMDRSLDAKKYEREIEGLTAELVDQFARGKNDQIFPRHRVVVARGLEFLATNLKAAKGTVGALGAWTDDFVKELDSKAGYVETLLLPKFQDQTDAFAEAEGKDVKEAQSKDSSDNAPLWTCPDCKTHHDTVPKECQLCGRDGPAAGGEPIRASEKSPPV